MTPEIQARAFEPFFTTKPVGKGSGLGLAQVFGIAKQSGGGVRIETAVGEGTIVRVYLPRAGGAAADPRLAEPVPAQALGRRLVLLVDDDNAVRKTTKGILRDLGCEVVDVASGRAALIFLARETLRPDFMVVDFAMPLMNGLELAREVGRILPELPILFVTGYADLTAMQAVSEDRIVQKPFTEQQLSRKIQMLLAQSSS
jgi:CheY-like chemotaxis protein